MEFVDSMMSHLTALIAVILNAMHQKLDSRIGHEELYAWRDFETW